MKMNALIDAQKMPLFLLIWHYWKKCSIKCESPKILYYEIELSNGDKAYQCTDNYHDSSTIYPLQYGIKCVDQCPEKTVEEKYICKLKCQDNEYFIKDEESKRKYKCVDQPNEYIGSNKECLLECPLQESFVNS